MKKRRSASKRRTQSKAKRTSRPRKRPTISSHKRSNSSPRKRSNSSSRKRSNSSSRKRSLSPSSNIRTSSNIRPTKSVFVHRPRKQALQLRLDLPRRSYRSRDLPSTMQSFTSLGAKTQYRVATTRCEVHGYHTQKCAQDPHCRMTVRGCELNSRKKL